MNPALSALRYYFPVERAGYVTRKGELGEDKWEFSYNWYRQSAVY